MNETDIWEVKREREIDEGKGRKTNRSEGDVP